MHKMIQMTTICGLVFATTGCLTGDASKGSSGENIIGGVDDAGDPSVVQLRFSTSRSTAGCTATVISPTVLLTAAHCVPLGSFNFQYNPAASANPFDLTAPGWISALRAVANPLFTGDPTVGHDVGVVLINPTDIAPSPLGAGPAVDSIVHAVGYGFDKPQSSAAGGGGGTKRQIDIGVSAVLTTEFTAGVDLQGTCHGDSGGPLFQNGVVVGTTSYGSTADCRGAGHAMRIDNNRDFLDLFLATRGGGGGGDSSQSCSVSVNDNGATDAISCASQNGGATSCECRVDGQLVSTCTPDDATSACSFPGNCCGF